MMKLALYILLAYILYRFVVGFVIPVYRTTRQVKKEFREMQERMNGQMKHQEQPAPEQYTEPKKPVGDYIDFEEVK